MNQLPKQSTLTNSLLFGSAIATLATGTLLVPPLSQKVRAELRNSPKATVDEVWQIVNTEFVDGNFNQVDWLQMRQELLDKEYHSRQEAYREIRKALRKLGDRYTRFLEPEEFTALTNQTSGEISGIGIRMHINEDTGTLTVIEPIENSPAIKAGIQAGDQILKIDNQPTSLMSLEEASQKMKGEIGTEISLHIGRQGGNILELTLTRAPIELPSVSYSSKEEDNLKVGYIKLEEFSAHAAEQMKEAIEELAEQEVTGFVLDLRGNPGGLLFASVDIARMWMEQGAIVRTVDRRGGDRQFAANQTAITDLPLVILVDENSASASEILAGALKDNQRATVVGTRTFGKGTVQSLHSLSDGSGLAVTISRYYPPSGVNINHKGIQPNIEQDLTSRQKRAMSSNPDSIASQDDPQYKRAVSVLKNTILSQQTQTDSEAISIR